jgi:hypothetical protein
MQEECSNTFSIVIGIDYSFFSCYATFQPNLWHIPHICQKRPETRNLGNGFSLCFTGSFTNLSAEAESP